MVRKRPRRSKRAPVQLTIAEHERVRALLTARLVCSAAWAEEVIRAIDAGEVDLFVTDSGVLKADFAKVEKVLRRHGAYPPGGLLTLMRRCPTCGRWTPATGHQKGLDDPCEDCHVNAAPDHVWSQWPSSPFAVAMAHIRACKLKVRQGRL
jgi:hypothetical protein